VDDDPAQAGLVDLRHRAIQMGDDGHALGLAGLEELHNPKQAANRILEDLQNRLDRLDVLPLLLTRIKLNQAAADILVELADGVLPLALHIGHAGEVLGRDTARVECAHGELCARLANGLGGDDADGLPDLDRTPRGHVNAVAQDADPLAEFAGERTPDTHATHAGGHHSRGRLVGEELAGIDDDLAGLLVDDRLRSHAAREPLVQRNRQIG